MNHWIFLKKLEEAWGRFIGVNRKFCLQKSSARLLMLVELFSILCMRNVPAKFLIAKKNEFADLAMGIQSFSFTYFYVFDLQFFRFDHDDKSLYSIFTDLDITSPSPVKRLF
jgi:hypothetical protein